LFFSNEYQFQNKEIYINQIKNKTSKKGEKNDRIYSCLSPEKKKNIYEYFTKIKNKWKIGTSQNNSILNKEYFFFYFILL